MMRALPSHCPELQFLLKSQVSLNKPICIFHRKCHLTCLNATYCSRSVRASCTAIPAAADSYNGWDDLRVWVDSSELGEPNYIKKFLILCGIYDIKYVFTCVLGFVCALAVSRVKVSSVVVFPVVLAIGFSLGFVNGGPSTNLSHKMSKDENLLVGVEKLRNLVRMFNEFDVKVGELKNDINKAIELERIELSELENYVNSLKLIDGLVSDARNKVGECIGVLPGVDESINQKNGRRRREISSNGFDLFGFVGDFVRNYVVGSNMSRSNVVKKDSVLKDVDNRGEKYVGSSRVERESDLKSSQDSGVRNRGNSNDGRRKNMLGYRDHERQRILQDDEMGSIDGDGRFNYRGTGYVDNQRFSFNMSASREVRKWASDDSINAYTEFDITEERQENGYTLKSQQIRSGSNGVYVSTEGRENVDYGRHGTRFRQDRINVEDELHTRKYQSQRESDRGSFSSSTISDDLLFNECITKANDLLKRAREHLKARNDEVVMEEMLLECAKLLSQAIAMKPISLLAIGLLGNTYLLHGELKLKTSRKLRSLLSRSNALDHESTSNLLSDETLPSKDRIATRLANVCEECESLFVEAGRKYRLALSIDGNDMRALYNWGLALFFRAQLIADIGPEAIADADKLFLASIDKFDAMMSKNNVYLPEALFRWGVALQQRSRLRPANSEDKVKLLQQAKRLYEDAIDMGSNNLQVRKALSSCMSELNFEDI